MVENLSYRVNGHHFREHEREDAAMMTAHPDLGLSLYGVLDGEAGRRAVDYAREKFPAEILLSDPKELSTHQQVQEMLLNAFEAVERGYMGSIDEFLAERAPILADIQGLDEGEASSRFPVEIQRLQELNRELSSGVTATLAVVKNEHLYVANVGDCRALLVKTDAEGCLRVVQLSVQHDTSNQDECLRLKQLGLDETVIRHIREPTRCIGDYPRKGGWADHDQYKAASDEPVLGTPSVHPPIPLDATAQFLILCTPGLCKAMEEVFEVTKVNTKLAQMVATQFEEAGSVAGVAQAVVDLVCRSHLDTFSRHEERSFLCRSRSDITLLVRNFNYPLRRGGCPWDDTLGTSSAVSTLPNPNRSALPLDNNGRIAPYVNFAPFYQAVKEYGKRAEGRSVTPQPPQPTES